MPNFLKFFRSSAPHPVRQKAKNVISNFARQNGSSQTDLKGKSKAIWQDPAEIGGDLLHDVIYICSDVINESNILMKFLTNQNTNSSLLTQIMILIETQKQELEEINPYTGQRKYPALITLEQIYHKVNEDVKETTNLSGRNAEKKLSSLIQVLQEGPDYLIDIIFITTIIHQASIISIQFSNEIRGILDKAINDHSNLDGFRIAAQSIIAISSAINRDLLEDKESEEAYKKIGVLIKLLQARISPSTKSTQIPSIPANRSISTSSDSASSIIPNSQGSISSTSSPKFTSLSTKEIQNQYGTGKNLPGLSSYQSTTYPNMTNRISSVEFDDSNSKSSSEISIWEYRGQKLTSSALQLILTEEIQLFSDSSGQYSGEVTYDDLRKTWIPKHFEKLKKSNLKEEEDGEIPDTTNLGFKLKEKDEWGNKIGWYDNGSGIKEMYYLEEPSFELKDDNDDDDD